MNALWAGLLAVGAGGADMTPEAVSRYQQANAAVTSGQYSAAIQQYNGLAAQYPRVAEIFAGRCSALVAVRNYSAAEADCGYALKLKPELQQARYALAIAEEGLGKRELAIAHYREYAALDERQAPFRQAASARADALSGSLRPPPPPPAPSSAAEPSGMSAPPMVTASEPAPSAFGGSVSHGGAKLFVYKNHLSASARAMLVLDGKLVGDISMDEYVEIETTPGEHLLEARSYPGSVYDAPRVWTRPVQLGPQPIYINFDLRGGSVSLVDMPAEQAVREIKSDCRKAFSRQIGADSVQAPPVQSPAVVLAPGIGFQHAPGTVVVIGGGGRECRFSSDCGDSFEFSCRSWRGRQVCMGHGHSGAPCWFSSDCVSNSCNMSSKTCR